MSYAYAWTYVYPDEDGNATELLHEKTVNRKRVKTDTSKIQTIKKSSPVGISLHIKEKKKSKDVKK